LVHVGAVAIGIRKVKRSSGVGLGLQVPSFWVGAVVTIPDCEPTTVNVFPALTW
jgi:hypothetical protein